MRAVKYLIIGILFGIVLYKSEAASWFRIYEMFRFESFHMYGIMGTALLVGILLVQSIKKFKIKAINGDEITFNPKDKSFSRYIFGGIFFGLGWGLVGSCPGPMFTLIGAGYMPILVVVIFAVLGTFLYGLIKHKLPH